MSIYSAWLNERKRNELGRPEYFNEGRLEHPIAFVTDEGGIASIGKIDDMRRFCEWVTRITKETPDRPDEQGTLAGELFRHEALEQWRSTIEDQP